MSAWWELALLLSVALPCRGIRDEGFESPPAPMEAPNCEPAGWEDAPELERIEIAPKWTANFSSLQGPGIFAYDLDGQRWSEQYLNEDGEVAWKWVRANTSGPYTLNVSSTEECTAAQMPYKDPFAFLAAGAHHIGPGTVAGEECEIWQREVVDEEHQDTKGRHRVCVGANGVPRQYIYWGCSDYSQGPLVSQTFSNIKVGSPDEQAFMISMPCGPPPHCPGEGTVQILHMYRVTDPEQATAVEDQDVGDALGDVAFICKSNFDWSDTKQGNDTKHWIDDEIVTHWEVRANSSWGQYANCRRSATTGNRSANRGRRTECYLGDAFQVGRQAPYNHDEPTQCGSNEATGSWYSLPARGRCAEGSEIGEDGCTWKATRKRSVSGKCVRDRGLIAKCKDKAAATAILINALASSESQQGGCPDVAVPDV